MGSRLAASLAGITLLAGVYQASAGELPAGATVRYDAPPACPDAREFMKRINERTERARVALPDDDAAVLVTVESVEDGFRARMSLQAPGGPTTREVSGPDCDSVSSAMALVAALAIESMPVERPKPEAPRCPPPPAPPPRVDGPMRLSNWSLGGAVEVLGAVAPDLMRVSEHFVELAPGNSSFRLSYVHGSEDSVQGELEARTLFNAGRIGVCPFGFGISTWSTVSPCVGATFGAVRVEGEATHSKTVSRVWADAMVTVRWQVRIGRAVSVFAEGGAIFPAVRYSYEFRNPDAEFHQTDAVAPFLAAGLKISLP